MIQPYAFIDGNADGDKERVSSATVQLYNKLSAEETNNLRDKVNETVDGVNAVSPPLFGQYRLRFKGDGNPNQLVFEAGDIAERYSADGITENAQYNGGDPQDPASYTVIAPERFPKIQFTYAGGPQDFDLGTLLPVTAVFWGGSILDDGDWDQVGNILTIDFPLEVGAVIKPI